MKTRKHILILFMGLMIVACENKSTPSKNLPRQETEIIIKNKNDYSKKFIKGLGLLDFRKIELIDSLFIMDETDTMILPTKIFIGKQAVYTGVQDNLAIAITVKWVNYTTIEYRIEMTEFGKASYEQSGQAEIELSLGFLLESESDDNEQTGEPFFVRAYIDNRENDCTTQIRLGIDGRQAKLYKNCNGLIRDIGADNFRTLLRK